MISIIVACTALGVIGKDGKLPWNIPEDLAYFKKSTLGKPVVMGNNTFKSIGKPLPGRKNIVISKKFFEMEQQPPAGVTMVKDLESALAECSDAKEVMIIGGGSIYKEALDKDLVDQIYLSLVHKHYPGDTFFPLHDVVDNFLPIADCVSTDVSYIILERNKPL